MTMPAIVMSGATLGNTYSGDPATTRRTGTNGAGTRFTLDIIQSLPKKDRWRHVLRCTASGNSPGLGLPRPSWTFTLTMDSPADAEGSLTAALCGDFIAGISPALDEVANGEQ